LHQSHFETLEFGSRLADAVAKGMGSWRFIIIQTLLVSIWMILNLVAYVKHWDVYPLSCSTVFFDPSSLCRTNHYDVSKQTKRKRSSAKLIIKPISTQS
jgi:hypothetical protein